jgi:hypothetical protein
VPVPVQIIPPIWTIAVVLLMRGVRRFPARLLTESADRESTAEKNKREEDNEKRKRRTQTTAGHKLNATLAPVRRSAEVESQPLKEDFHVLERLPVLGSQFLRSEIRGAK